MVQQIINMNRDYKITPNGEWFKVEVSDEYNNNTQTNNKIKSIYKDKTDIPDEQLKQYFMKDIYLTAETCKLYNIVHHIF